MIDTVIILMLLYVCVSFFHLCIAAGHNGNLAIPPVAPSYSSQLRSTAPKTALHGKRPLQVPHILKLMRNHLIVRRRQVTISIIRLILAPAAPVGRN